MNKISGNKTNALGGGAKFPKKFQNMKYATRRQC